MSAEKSAVGKMSDLVTVKDAMVLVNLPNGAYIGFPPDAARRVAAHMLAAADEAEGKPRPTHMMMVPAGGEADS